MILYNVTVKIDLDIETEWLTWMKANHISKIINTGYFYDYKLFKLLNEQGNDGITYAVQYFSHSLDDVEKYLEEYGHQHADEHRIRFKDKHVAFRTLLESV